MQFAPRSYTANEVVRSHHTCTRSIYIYLKSSVDLLDNSFSYLFGRMVSLDSPKIIAQAEKVFRIETIETLVCVIKRYDQLYQRCNPN